MDGHPGLVNGIVKTWLDNLLQFFKLSSDFTALQKELFELLRKTD
jgi:hypothetical protein